MSIYNTYARYILERLIQQEILAGNKPSYKTISNSFNAYLEEHDLTQPVFSATDFYATTPASASSYNSALQQCHQDIRVSYKHLLVAEDGVAKHFDRWKFEASRLETRLKDLDRRMSNLLLVAKNTEGYFNYVYDSLTTNAQIDLTRSTTTYDTTKGLVSLGTSSTGVTKLDLSDSSANKIEFTVLTQNGMSSTSETTGSVLSNILDGKTNFWQQNVYMTKPTTVTTELVFKFQTSQTFTRVDIDLHGANQNGKLSVTPMYSSDGYNWTQLPITSYTQEVIDRCIFMFPAITTSRFKLLLTKTGHDRADNSQYIYEFGLDEVSFYQESYSTSSTLDGGSQFYSKVLSVLDTNKQPQEFARAALEVCQSIPTSTSIDYYVAATNTTTAPADTAYMTITPVGVQGSSPNIIDFGEQTPTTVSGVAISYDAAASTSQFVNPGKTYTLIQSISSGGVATLATVVSSARRYIPAVSSIRILDHAVASGVQISDGTLEVWRNVAIKGSSSKVRGYQRGWGFAGAWYSTTIFVGNKAGVSVDFGPKPVELDGASKSGKMTISYGAHKIRIHQDNWKAIDLTSVTNLATLKTADPLYPYNQRYLVEGLLYPSGWSVAEEKLYMGFDIVAEYKMAKVSVFDMLSNLSVGDYSRYAVDADMADPSATIGGTVTSRPAQTVVALRVDESYADFTNERFILKWNSSVTRYKYLWLKASLKTQDTSVTPALDSYMIKVSN